LNKKFFNRVIFWILLLTFTSGYANVLSIFRLGTPTTHMTGNLSNISFSIFELDFKKAAILFTIVLLFLLGGIISGYIFNNRSFGKGKSYGVFLIVIGILLGMAEYIIGEKYIITAIIALTSGTQNGLNIAYNEITIRTTHMTGYLSDIGRLIGIKLNGRKIETSKLLYLISAVVIYFLGGAAAVFISLPDHGHNFYEISFLYIIAGFLYLKLIYNKDGK